MWKEEWSIILTLHYFSAATIFVIIVILYIYVTCFSQSLLSVKSALAIINTIFMWLLRQSEWNLKVNNKMQGVILEVKVFFIPPSHVGELLSLLRLIPPRIWVIAKEKLQKKFLCQRHSKMKFHIGNFVSILNRMK